MAPCRISLPISTSRTLLRKHGDSPNFDKPTKLALTAKLNSIGSSGGTTLVIISTQSNSNLLFFKSLSTPEQKSIGRQQNTKAVQQKMLTLNPNIPTGSNSKNQQEPNEQKALQI